MSCANQDRLIAGTLREVNSGSVVTQSTEPLVVDLFQPDFGTPNRHWVLQELTFAGLMTVTLPSPFDLLSGFFLCPAGTPTETLAQALKGVNLLARPYLLPKIVVAGSVSTQQEVLSPASPAIGAPFTFTAMFPFQLISASFTLGTSASATPRTVKLIATNMGVTALLAASGLESQVGPNATVRVIFGLGVAPSVPGSTLITGSLPAGFIIQTGTQLGLIIDNFDGTPVIGDSISNVQLTIAALSSGGAGLQVMWGATFNPPIIVPQNWFLRAIVTPTPGGFAPGPGAGSSGSLRALVADQSNAV